VFTVRDILTEQFFADLEVLKGIKNDWRIVFGFDN
jgi:hypothetical protein